MRSARINLWTNLSLSALLAGTLSLAACGGGGSAPPGTTTVVDGPPSTTMPPVTPPGTGGGGGTPLPPPGDGGGGTPPPGGGGDTLPPVPGPAPMEVVLASIADVRSVATGPAEGQAYAIFAVDGSGTLWQMGPEDAVPQHLYALGPANITALAYVPAFSSLFLMLEGRALARFDLPTSTVSSIGTLTGFDSVRALEWDNEGGQLLGVDAETGKLLRINHFATPPAFTSVGTAVIGTLPPAFAAVEALAFDRLERRLYGADLATRSLIEISTTDAKAVARARLPRATAEGLGYLEQGDRFVVADSGSGQLLLWDAKGHDINLGSVFGLDYDVPGQRLLGVHQGQAMLIAIDPATGWKSWVGWIGVGGIESLAVDGVGLKGYGVDNGRDVLVRIDLLTGQGADVGPLQGAVSRGSDVAGLTFDPVAGRLYGIDGTTGSLVLIDPTTAASTPVRSLPYADLRGLAFEPERNLLHTFDVATRTHVAVDALSLGLVVEPLPSIGSIAALGYDVRNRVLWGIDPANSLLVRVWQHPTQEVGFSEVRALALVGERLLGFDQATDTLIEIDRTTGAGHVVAATAAFDIEALTYNPTDGWMYASDLHTGRLLRVDPVEGRVEFVGPLTLTPPPPVTPADLRGLAVDTESGVMYGVDRANRKLVRFVAGSSASPVRMDLAPFGLTDLQDLAYDPHTRRLIAVDAAQKRLVEIDPVGLTLAEIGPIQPADVRALAVEGLGVLVVVDRATGRVVRLNRFTGETLP